MDLISCSILVGDMKQWRLGGSMTGSLHREDGPAIEYADGSRSWYNNGRLHRVDGPAIYGVVYNLETYFAFFINGKRLTIMEFVNHDLVSEETAQEVLTKWM